MKNDLTMEELEQVTGGALDISALAKVTGAGGNTVPGISVDTASPDKQQARLASIEKTKSDLADRLNNEAAILNNVENTAQSVLSSINESLNGLIQASNELERDIF